MPAVPRGSRGPERSRSAGRLFGVPLPFEPGFALASNPDAGLRFRPELKDVAHDAVRPFDHDIPAETRLERSRLHDWTGKGLFLFQTGHITPAALVHCDDGCCRSQFLNPARQVQSGVTAATLQAQRKRARATRRDRHGPQVSRIGGQMSLSCAGVKAHKGQMHCLGKNGVIAA